jgi:hypothetical protein
MIPGATSRKSLGFFFAKDLAKAMVFQWDLFLPGAFGFIHCFGSKSGRFDGLMNMYRFLRFVNEGVIIWFEVHICWKVQFIMLTVWMFSRIDELEFAMGMRALFVGILSSCYNFAFKGSVGPINIGVYGG